MGESVRASLVFDSVGFRTEDGDTLSHDKVAGPVDLPVAEFERLAALGAVVEFGSEPETGDVVEQGDGQGEPQADPFAGLSVKQLQAVAVERGVKLPGKAKRDEIVALLQAASEIEAESGTPEGGADQTGE